MPAVDVAKFRLPPRYLAMYLSRRQHQMLALLAAGLDKAAIAAFLGVEQNTVYTTFRHAESRLREMATSQSVFMPEEMTTPMWVRYGMSLKLDEPIVPRAR